MHTIEHMGYLGSYLTHRLPNSLTPADIAKRLGTQRTNHGFS